LERILIKPDAKEIILRGKPEDGHVDVFSYNYESGAASNLGGLFIVGQVQPATEDTSYMINLIASLAKREYYAKPDTSPKEAFSKTLKKVNEVLQDFFRNKETKVNIGIFSIAGENILISRLGKFKIILSRNDENIDILNNIILFDKEHIQEKEFSNIISGKIIPKDKIFAYYPGRSIVAREKNMKADFLKLGADEFSARLSDIKKTSENFLCAGVHITINKHSEPALTESPQPRELRTVLAKSTKATKIKTASSATSVVADLPDLRPAIEPAPQEAAPSIKIEPAPKSAILEPVPEVKSTPETDVSQSNVYYPGSKGLMENVPKSSSLSSSEETESPLIRPSEFSSATKDNFLNLMLRKYKPSGIYIIGQQPLITQKRMITALSILLVVVGASIGAKLTFLPSLPVPGISSEQDKALSLTLEKAKTALESAQAFKDQNNLLEARRVLIDSMSAIAVSNLNDEDLQKAKNEAIALLDQIDKAVEVSPNLLYQISQESGKGTLLSLAKERILVFTSGADTTGGAVITGTENGIESTTAVSGFNPLYIFGSDQLIVMFNKLADQIGSLTLKDGGLKTSSLSLSGSIISIYPYQGNVYILTSESIFKIADATQGKSTPIKWLAANESLPIEPKLIAVDSRIYIISQNGILTTYYKGEKESEVSTSIPVDSESILLTTPDSKSLFLVDKSMGRVYVLSKSSGTLEKTIKLSSDQPLVSASMSDGGVIYLLTADNNVWKITP